MTKTAKVEQVMGTRKWDGPNGTVYYLDLLMDNGDRGSIGKKSEDALKPGSSLTYELETGERGNKIKEVREGNGFKGFGAYQPPRNGSFALSYAKDIIIAQIAAGKTGELKTMDLADATTKVAEKFAGWLKEHE